MKAHKTEHILVDREDEFSAKAFDADELYWIYWDSSEIIFVRGRAVHDLIIRPRSDLDGFNSSYTDKYPL